MNRHLPILAIPLFLAGAAFGQRLTPSSASAGPNGVYRGTATFNPALFAPASVVGAPYYGEHLNERVQTLANGVHITQTNTTQKVWRDSQGRTRTERPMMGPQTSSPTIVEIVDPVAGYTYTLDTEKQVAHRVTLTAPPVRSQGGSLLRGTISSTIPIAIGGTAAAVSQAAAAQRVRPEFTLEPLGTKTIDGVEVEGTRQTSVYPTGSQNNDAPFSVVAETWRSQKLRLVVFSTTDDPRSGVNTQKIANINEQEPDPTLFMVPPGYSTVDETGQFTITWGGQ